MKTTKITQEENTFLHTVKTVEWLVDNTSVSVFDPVRFDGYQREISDNHCEKIVKYLMDNFYLPTPIICACDEEYTEDTTLRIVDGQHRVEAFRKLKFKDFDRYNQIKNNELSVIVMQQVDIELEIDTFITINKTSKRVDTSLAYVLKNKLNIEKNSQDLTISKLDYIAVELAVKISETNSLWESKISFTGSPSLKGPEVISLNAFVKATRRLIGQLDRNKIIEINWENKTEIEKCVEVIREILDDLWGSVLSKWPGLFKKDHSYLKIIQGPIGYSSITRFIANEIKNLEPGDIEEIIDNNSISMMISEWIDSVTLSEEVWYPSNSFSKLSSESGYNIIASEMKHSIKQ